AAPSTAEPAEAPAPTPPPPAPAPPAAGDGSENGRSFVSPVVARIAAEHGVDVAAVQGTGQGGRVTKKDILAFIESADAASTEARSPAPPAAPAAPAEQPAPTAPAAPTEPSAPP